MTSRTDTTDLLVVGGGPAGLATAIRARQVGLSVQVIDRARPPIDRACGEGLMPDGVTVLRSLGVEIPFDERRVFHGIRYLDADVCAEGRFSDDGGWGIRRPTLHEAMARRAEEAGVELHWGTQATGLEENGVTTDCGLLSSAWVIAADGRKSRLRRWAGLAAPPARRRRFGVSRHFAIEPWSDLVEVHWADGCEAYVTPVAPRMVGVALLWSRGKSSFDRLLPRFPVLERRLAGAPVASKDRGAGPLEQRAGAVYRGRLALVGDASGYLDPITGEGLALAFSQAIAVVDAVQRADLSRYGAAHRRHGRLPIAITRLLLWAKERPRLRRRLIHALAADPGLFSRLLAVHARQLKVRDLGVASLLRLLRRLA